MSLLVQIAAIVTENNNPQLPNINIHILRTFFFTFDVTNKENLFDNQEFLRLAIISYILMTFTFDSSVTVYGEIRSQSLFGVEGLMSTFEERELENERQIAYLQRVQSKSKRYHLVVTFTYSFKCVLSY